MSGGLICGGATITAVLCVSLSASAATQTDIQRALVLEANQNQVPVSLALAVAKVESGFNAGALSPKGARGVMQIMPTTAMGEFGVEADRLWDAGLNVRLGVQYLKRLHETYGGRWDLALSHYNGGTVKGDSPTSYTVEYVLAVQAWQNYYEQRGCDRLTAKRIVTHADSFALCLQGGGPIVNASLTVEAPEPEPGPPVAAPQTPVQKVDLAKPAAQSQPASVTVKPQSEKASAEKAPAEKALTEKALAEKALTEKAQAEKALAEKAPAEKSLAEKIQAEKAKPAARSASATVATAEPSRQRVAIPQPTAESPPTVTASEPQPWLPPVAVPQPVAPVSVVAVPAYRAPPTPVYFGRPRRPGFARGKVQFRGPVGPRGSRWW